MSDESTRLVLALDEWMRSVLKDAIQEFNEEQKQLKSEELPPVIGFSIPVENENDEDDQ